MNRFNLGIRDRQKSFLPAFFIGYIDAVTRPVKDETVVSVDLVAELIQHQRTNAPWGDLLLGHQPNVIEPGFVDKIVAHPDRVVFRRQGLIAAGVIANTDDQRVTFLVPAVTDEIREQLPPGFFGAWFFVRFVNARDRVGDHHHHEAKSKQREPDR